MPVVKDAAEENTGVEQTEQSYIPFGKDNKLLISWDCHKIFMVG